MRDPRHPGWPDAGERTELRDVADRWKWAYVDLMHEQHRGRVLGRSTDRTLASAVAEFLEHRERVVEPATFSSDRTALNHLLETYAPSKPVAGIETQRYVDRLVDAGYRPSTIGQYCNALRAFWRWTGVDFPAPEIPNPGQMDVRYWTDEEVELVRQAPPEWVRLLDTTLYMGLRISEAVALRWSDIRGDTVRIQRQITQGRTEPKPLKGKRARTALILSGWQHPPGKGWVAGETPPTHHMYQRWLRKHLEDIGLYEVGTGWHTGRHTYARMVLEGGGSLEQLKQFLGHSSITTTEDSYGHFRPSVALEAARRALRSG